ncbi:MAG: hypothetical protein JNM21_01535 [Taibaiella sp.]|nr:hypothetical protein [Taibaiella sp.]
MPNLDLTNINSLKNYPEPTNERLKTLFSGIDIIIIKDGGVCGNQALKEEVVLTLNQQNDIIRFSELLSIDESQTGFHCMCLGNYAIELHSEEALTATIGLHHGQSIRYDYWNSDAFLTRNEDLLIFLSEKGLEKPLEDRLKELKNKEAAQLTKVAWLQAAPECFKKYWEQINHLNEDYIIPLSAELATEIPDKQQKIITLLQLFGKTDNLWADYPVYEECPNAILKTFEVSDIIQAYLNSERNYKTRKGLGRFLCAPDFKRTRTPHLKHLTEEVITDLERCFNYLGQKRGINEIFALKNHTIKQQQS